MLDLDLDALGDRTVFVADREVVGSDRGSLARLDLRERKMDGRLIAGDFDQFEFLELLRFAASLARRVGVRAVARDELLQLFPLSEGRRVETLVVLAAFIQVLEVSLHIAREHRQGAARQLERVVAGLLQERPIVRNDQDTRLEVVQEVFQQDLRPHVEEVGPAHRE